MSEIGGNQASRAAASGDTASGGNRLIDEAFPCSASPGTASHKAVSRSRTLRVAATTALVAALGFTLAGCAGSVPMQPAEDANNPACADVVVRLPKTVAGLDKRATDAQATGAWGDPVGVELRCGIEPSGPTTDDCVNVNGVDWIIDRTNAPLYRFEAYGRSPGLEVYVNNEIASGTSTVTDLAAVAKILPQTRQCLSLMDFEEPSL